MSAAERQVVEFKPQDLANTAWAFATFDQPTGRPLFMALAREAERRVGDLSARDLRSMMWAFDQLDIRSPKLIQKIGAAASQLVGQSGTMVLFAELTKLMEDRGLTYSLGMTVKQMQNDLYTYDRSEG